MAVAIRVAVAISAFALAVLSPCASASAFLRSREPGELRQVTLEMVERTLLAELAMDTARVTKLEEELRPMFAALPKNEHSSLEPAVVRYALHRYFVQKHGWYVKGLEPAGQAWNSSAPASITKSRVPAYIQGLFEERLHGQGMGLHDLAIFAATMLDFVNNAVLSDVVDLYSAFRFSTTSPTHSFDVDSVIRAYILQVLDGNFTITSRQDMRDLEAAMLQDFPDWGGFKTWVQDVRQTISWERSRKSLLPAEFMLDNVVEEVQELNNRLGAFQDIECRTIKGGLADIEYKGTGRVPLSDFYRVGLEGEYLFIEPIDYLRKLGALDESDPRNPSVIIANYLAGQANCLASTSFHSVCCFDECEGLMGHLERSIAAPSAPAGRIAELVASLRSESVDAPRNLSASLLSRLGEIAEHHSGAVPLHGRLFAQWMHHAYPLECPYPHEAGTTAPLTPAEWMDASGADELAASEQERKRFIKEDVSPDTTVEALPWTSVEELVVTHRLPKAAPPRLGMLRKVAAFAAVMSMAVPIAKLSATFTKPSTKWEHLV